MQAGETVEVNARVMKAPTAGFTLVSKGRLWKASIVSLGSSTAVHVATGDAASNRKRTSTRAGGGGRGWG